MRQGYTRGGFVRFCVGFCVRFGFRVRFRLRFRPRLPRPPHDPRADLARALRPAEIPRRHPRGDRVLHELREPRFFSVDAEVAEHHADREHRRERVREVLAGDVGRAPVHGLEHPAAARLHVRPACVVGAHVGARGHPEASLQGRAEIGDDVAEEVVRDDHVVALGRAHHLQAEGIDVHVTSLDARVLLGHLVEAAAPEAVRVGHRVGLVGHVHALLAVLDGVREGRADDALDALAGVHVLVDRDLVRRALLEVAADVDVDALRVLPEHDHVAVLGSLAAQGHEGVREAHDGAHVAVEVEAEAQPEEDVARVVQARDPGVADRAQEHGVALVAHECAVALGEGRPVAEEAVGSQVEVRER